MSLAYVTSWLLLVLIIICLMNFERSKILKIRLMKRVDTRGKSVKLGLAKSQSNILSSENQNYGKFLRVPSGY